MGTIRARVSMKKEKTTNSHARFHFALLQGTGDAGDGVVADPRELDRWPPNFGQVTILPVLPGHDLGVGARRDLGGDEGEDAGDVAGVQVEEVGVVAGEDVEDAGAGHLATVTPGRRRHCPL